MPLSLLIFERSALVASFLGVHSKARLTSNLGFLLTGARMSKHWSVEHIGQGQP